MAHEPLNLNEFEAAASRILPANIYDSYRTGSADEITLRDNVEAYKRVKLRPRVLRDVSSISTASTLLGHAVTSPIHVAPTARMGMAHDDAETGVAEACAAAGRCMTVSIASTRSIEAVSAAAGAYGLLWQQIYVYKERRITEFVIRRAEKAGYKALVLTVDNPIVARRECMLRHARGDTTPSHLTLANFVDLPPELVKESTLAHDYRRFWTEVVVLDDAMDWSIISWIRSISSLPIVLKGIISAEDAVHAASHGVAAVWVSNHGGRQLDGCIATLDALSPIVDALKGRPIEVYVDGGIRRGGDVFKALALGAHAVFIGRPVLWSLAYGGKAGVSRMLDLLQAELVETMKLAGTASLHDITSDYVVAASIENRRTAPTCGNDDSLKYPYTALSQMSKL